MNWTAILAFTTPVATVVLAVVAGWSLRLTTRMATAAEAAIEETQRDRELAWRPHLVLAITEGDLFDEIACNVKNIGRGPALRCRVVVPLEGSGLASPQVVRNPTRVDLGAGGTELVPLESCTGAEEVQHLQAGMPERFAFEEKFVPLCVCDDQFDGMYLFQEDRAPAYWRPGLQGPRLGWTAYREES